MRFSTPYYTPLNLIRWNERRIARHQNDEVIGHGTTQDRVSNCALLAMLYLFSDIM
jgi:hypothetical protein